MRRHGALHFQERLERGRFASLFRDDDKSSCRAGGGRRVQLTSSELALFIEGCELVGRLTLSPSITKPKFLALDRPV